MYGSYGGYTYGSRSNSAYSPITNTDINDLIRLIENGNDKQVMQKYNQLNISGNSMVRNRVENYFANKYGTDLTTALTEKSGSAFTSGAAQGLFFGLGSIFDDGFCASELEEKITGVDESKLDKFAEAAGGGVSGGLSGAAVGVGAAAAIGALAVKMGIAGSVLGPAGAIAGAAIGGLIGIVTGVVQVCNKDKENNKKFA